jgi:hypothetical protein
MWRQNVPQKFWWTSTRSQGVKSHQPVLFVNLQSSHSFGILSQFWVTVDGVWIGDSIYWSLIQVVTTNNYKTMADFHILAESSPACSVFTTSFLVTASEPGDSSALRAQVLSSRTPLQNWLGGPSCPHGTVHAETPCFQEYFYARQFVATGTCSLSRCLENSLVYSPISWSSRSNGSTCYNILFSQ